MLPSRLPGLSSLSALCDHLKSGSAFLVSTLLLTTPAWAHETHFGLGGFYDGLIVPVLFVPTIISVVCYVLMSAEINAKNILVFAVFLLLSLVLGLYVAFAEKAAFVLNIVILAQSIVLASGLMLRGVTTIAAAMLVGGANGVALSAGHGTIGDSLLYHGGVMVSLCLGVAFLSMLKAFVTDRLPGIVIKRSRQILGAWAFAIIALLIALNSR